MPLNRYFVALRVHAFGLPSIVYMTDTESQATHWLLRAPYGIYAWLTFVVCLSAAVLAAVCVPGLDRRRAWVGGCARGFFRCAGIRCRIRGMDQLPGGHCVVVANHASYLDGVILQAFLPPRFSYVIKSEMKKIPLAHFLLRRIGSQFVDRFSAAASARDARNLLRAANSGRSMAFFPEGTFIAEPGLGKFRLGAFATAIKARSPLVPLVIRGSRHILPAKQFLPRRAALTIDVLPPIGPDAPGFARHRLLAQETRQRMLPVLGEPDLAPVADDAG